MNNLFRLIMTAGAVAVALLILLVGVARHDANLLAPVNLLLFAVSIAIYLLPTVLAIYRDCQSVLWIAAINVLLGWTIFGWVIAIGWAAGGKANPLPPSGTPYHPLPTH